MNKILHAALFRYTCVGTIVSALVAGAAVSFWYGVEAGAVVLLGGIFGLALLAAIVHSAHQITGKSRRPTRSRFISALPHIGKWLVIAVIIYFITRSGARTALFFAGGYTLSLIALVVGAAFEKHGDQPAQGTDDRAGDPVTDG